MMKITDLRLRILNIMTKMMNLFALNVKNVNSVKIVQKERMESVI